MLVLALLERHQPPVTEEGGNDLVDNGVAQSFLALEMMVERSFVTLVAARIVSMLALWNPDR
jgi:hypothetical protein